MFRRMLITSLLLTAISAVALGIVYPLVVTGIAQAVFPGQANGSIVYRSGKAVGSSLIGQEFLNAQGNPDPRYFQPRPSAAGTGYNGLSSGASNLGPSDPRLVGFIPGLNTVALNGQPSKVNPFASKADPYLVPLDPNGIPVIHPTPGQKYAKNKDGYYLADPNTVPERAIAYRALNHLAPTTPVPVDAVTASASGLDPGISVANADLQAPRVAQARGIALGTVLELVKKYTTGPQLGFVGERYVNVLELNLALDGLRA